jgi:hypothetical protein
MDRPKKIASAQKVRYLRAGDRVAVLWPFSRYGYPSWRWIAGARVPAGRPVDWHRLKREGCETVRLPTGSAGAAAPARYCDPGTLSKRTPSLASFLTSAKYDGTEQERDPGSLTVRGSSEGFVVILRDPTSRQQLRLLLPGITELYEALELALKAPETPWEGDPYANPRKKLKKPKGG